MKYNIRKELPRLLASTLLACTGGFKCVRWEPVKIWNLKAKEDHGCSPPQLGVSSCRLDLSFGVNSRTCSIWFIAGLTQ